MFHFFVSYVKITVSVLILFYMNVSVVAADDLNAHPAMWLIERDDAKVYFLGSVHLLPEDVKWYGGSLQQIVESADEVVFEVHMTPEKEARARQITLANGLLENGDNLNNHLPPDEYDFLLKTADSIGIPAASISGFKPWFASIALSIGAIQKQGWDTESGVDKYIEKLISSKDVEISELETLEFQMSTLYDHPIDVQADMLKDTLEQIRDIKKLTLDMVTAWAQGDEQKMFDTFVEPMQYQREIYRRLVIERNNNWIPVIEKLVTKPQTTLIVAGAAHFIGKDGLVELLEQRGYDIKRVQ